MKNHAIITSTVGKVPPPVPLLNLSFMLSAGFEPGFFEQVCHCSGTCFSQK